MDTRMMWLRFDRAVSHRSGAVTELLCDCTNTCAAVDADLRRALIGNCAGLPPSVLQYSTRIAVVAEVWKDWDRKLAKTLDWRSYSR